MASRTIVAFAAFVVTTLSVPGIAQNNSKVSISKNDCSRLVRHTPSADVAYKPGVDVRGRKVAGADVEGRNDIGSQLLPEVLEIPIQISPMAGKAYATNGLGDSQTTLGTVKYDMAKGTFTLNGKPLAGEDQQHLAEACAKRGAK
jgi:hypothetical protein